MAVQYNFKDDSWSGIVKSIKDKTTGNLDISDKTKKNLETLKDLQGTTGAAGDLKSLFSDIDEDFSKFLDKVDMSGDVFKQYQTHMKKNQESTSLFQRATKAAGGVVKSLGATLGSMAAMWAIGEVISLIATGIDNTVHKVEYAQERLEDFDSSMKETKDTLKSQQYWITENGETYSKLAKGVDNYGHNVSLTTDEFKQYNEITNQIADMFPDMVQGYNDQNEAIIKNKGNVEALTKAYKESAKAKYADIMTKSSSTYSDYKDAISDAQDQKDKITSFMNAKEIKGFATSDGSYQIGIGNEYYYEMFKDLLSEEDNSKLNEEIRNLISERAEAGQNDSTFTFDDLSAQLQSKIRAALITANTTVSTETAKVKPLLEAYIYGDNNSGYDKLSEKGQQAIKNVIANLDEGFYSKFSSDNDMFAYFQNNFIEPLKDAINGDELAIEINTLFEFDKSKYKNYSDYIAAVEAKINQLKNAKDENGNPIFTDEQIDQLRKSKGVADVDSDGNVSGRALINKTKEKYKNINGAESYIDTLTEDEIRYIEGLEYEIKTVDEIKNAVEKLDKDTQAKAKSSKKSFSSIWGALKDSEQKSLKKSVLAGTFDQEELDKYQTLADNFSLKQVRQEILDTIALDDKISQFLSDTDKLTSAYQEMKKNGTVSTKTLQGMPDGLRNIEGYTDFRNTVSSSKTSKADKKSSFERLITEYIQTNDTIKNVTSETRDYAINALKDIGVTNAESVVDSQLEATETVKKAAKEIESLNYDELQNFLKIANSKGKINAEMLNKIGENTSILFNSLSGKYKKDLTNYTTVLQKKLEADAEYQKEKAKLENIETALQDEAPSITKTNPYLSQISSPLLDYQKENVDKSKKKLTKAKKDLQKLQKKLEKILKSSKLTKLSYNPTSSSSSNKNSNSSGSTTTNQIDWIERKLTVLSKKLDVAKSKYDALFATSKAKTSDTFVDQQNKALNEQIKIQDKVIAANNKAEKSYSKIAKKYAKKISSTHKNLVQYGGYTIENFTTKDTTSKTKKSKKGTKKVKVTKNEYDNIQKYIEYLDKVSDAQSNKSKAQQDKVNLQIEQKQNSQTRAETKQSMYKAQEENSSGLSKNNYVKDQITQLTKSYNLQIEIARLQKDYDKAKQLEAEKQKQINQLRYHEVENIKTAYENQVSLLDAQEANIQSQIDLAEARGDIVSKSYYSSMSNSERQKQSKYTDELNKLKSEQSNFATGSDEWYDLQKDIQDVVKKISSSEKAIVENTKAIGGLNDKMYESIDSTASNLDAEVDFLAGLVPGETTDSDTGKLTDAGLAKLYAAGISYSAYQATAEIENARLKQIQDANKSGTLLEGYTSLQAQKDAESTIAQAAQKANNSIKSHADEIVDLMKSAIDASMNYLQDIIDARKDILSQEKELYDYQKQLLEKTKTVSSLQKQLYASSGDYSEEGRLKTAQLRQSLDEAQQDLQDTEYDKYISDQQEMLDNLMDEYKDLMEDLQKNESELLKQGIAAINDNKTVMDNIFKKTASDYGYPTSTELNNAQSALAGGLISVMNSGNENSITSVIKAECKKIVKAYSNVGGNNSPTSNNNGSATTTPQNPTQQGTGTGSVGGTAAQENGYAQEAKRMAEIKNFEAWLNSISGNGMNKPLKKAKSGKKYSSDINKALSKYGYVVKRKGTKLSGGVEAIDDFARRLDPTITSGDGKFSKDGMAYQALKKKYGSLGFKTGGIGTLVKASGEDGIAMVRNGEGFISPENVKDIKDLMNLVPDITSFMTPKMDMGKYVDKLSPVNRTVNVDNITFELPNVKNTVDFTDTIKTPSQQKAFASAIGDAINGNRLNINRY